MSLLHAVGGGATEDKLYVEDVFSTYLYTGNSSTQTINNGIDLAGKGGLVWIKNRKNATWNALFDTARGVNKYLTTNDTAASATYAAFNQTFTSNGFALNTNESMVNASAGGDYYASWTFRKAPKFFDIVTYTGNGVAGRQIPHNLGCEVGMVVVKKTSATGNWATYHKNTTPTPQNTHLLLNSTQAHYASVSSYWGETMPTTTSFTVGSNTENNGLGATYVAYLFAHDPSADGIIQCGSFTTDGSGNASVNLGWETQWMMIKRTDSSGDWITIDNMRGCSVGGIDAVLFPNLSNAESVANDYINFTPTGFISNNLTGTYIYTVIRRPMKTPTSGTEVYNAIARTGTGAVATVTGVGFAPDSVMVKPYGVASSTMAVWHDKLRGSLQRLRVEQTFDEGTATESITSFDMSGYTLGASADANAGGVPLINWCFKRAKGFFDNFCWTGTGVNRTIAHNLGVAPELLILKSRRPTGDWQVWLSGLASNEKLVLNSTAAKVTDATLLNSTLPTSTLISLGTQAAVNTSSATYVGYAFSSLAGVQKIGTYVGNGTTQNLNFGFSAGARFFLCKAITTTGSYWVFDSVRGIVASTDFGLQLNSTAAEVTSADCVDPFVGGISVVEEATCHLNTNGVTYMYWAIA